MRGNNGKKESQLVERFPIETVAEWLGNTPKVALKHYFDLATNETEKKASATDAVGSKKP